MSRILKVSQSDYRVKVQDSGTITLDTGVNVGTVVITGNLIVQGDSTTINTANMEIEDNIILLNRGETGSGVTLGKSGIEIDRGLLSDAQMIFDESVSHYDPLTTSNINGTFIFKTVNGELSGIQIASLSTNNATNLVFDLQNSNSMLSIVNSTDYESRLLPLSDSSLNNYVPNRKFVTDYVNAGLVASGVADVDRIYKGHGLFPVVVDTEVRAFTSSIEFFVGGTDTINTRAQITSNGLDVDDINSFGHTITSSGTYNLVLTAVNNNVEVNAVLNLDDQVSTPSPTSGKTKLYSKSIAGPGKSGLFFANNITSDELVAKNRALLFSMLF